MSIRTAVVASFALAMLPTPAIRNAAVTTRYRVESKNETTVDLSGFGAPSQQQNFTVVSWIAVTVSDTTGGRIVHVVVDSMTYTGTIPLLSQATADSAKGGTVHGIVDLGGRLKNLTAQPQNLLLADVQGALYGFFPRVKGGAKTGDVWSDTVEVTSNVNGANVKSTFWINYTSTGQESVAGVTALKLSATSSANVTGTLENPQMGSMEVEGKITGTSTGMLGPDGRYLGGTSNSTADQKLKSAMAPGPIPVKTVRTTTVTFLP
jgi:hypothetical protein